MLPQDGVQIDLGVPIMSLKELTDNKRKTYQQLHLTLYYALTIGWYSTEIYQILLRIYQILFPINLASYFVLQIPPMP